MYLRGYLQFLAKGLTTGNLVTDRKESVVDIDFKELKAQGAQLLIFDFDDTLGEFHATSLPTNVKELLVYLQKDFKLALFSNCTPERNEILNQVFRGIDIYMVERSDKPNRAGYEEIFDHFSISAANAVMVGDKVGTDMWGAYISNVKHRILVEPYSEVFGGRKTKIIDRVIKAIEKKLYIK